MRKKAVLYLPNVAILIISIILGGIFIKNNLAKVEAEGNSIEFTERAVFSRNNPRDVYAIDIDNDNDMDIVAGYADSGITAWYENNGSESFTEHIIRISNSAVHSVYAIDVDSDGDIDILNASDYTGSVYDTIAWYENNGSESFIEHVITNSANGARSVYAIDVDGDYDIDVLSASAYDDTIAWYENDGNENFTEHIITSSANGARDVYAIDIDNDNDIDVLSASANDDTIAWYENDGNENFTEHIITTNANSAISIYAIDMDNDNDIDVLYAANLDDTIAWYENNGSQGFIRHTITSSADGAYDVYAIDLDNDNDMDILGVSNNNDTIAWYENNGSEIFTEHIISDTIDGPVAVYAIDLDNDNDIDVISPGSYQDAILWYENTNNPAYCNDGIQNGDETGVDCGGSCQYSCIVPVIVVHGYRQDVEDIGILVDNLDERLDNPIYALDYAPEECDPDYSHACTIDSIKYYSNKLSHLVDEKLAEHNARYVDLVGYSMGGLISRWYVQDTDTNKVRNLIQIATPNHGAVTMAPAFLKIYESTFDIIDPEHNNINWNESQSTLQMAKSSSFIGELNGYFGIFFNNEKVNYKVNYNLIGGDKGDWWSFLIPGPDDSLVSEFSLQIYNDYVPNPVIGNLNHYEIYKNTAVADHIANIINGVAEKTFSNNAAMELVDAPQIIGIIEDQVNGQNTHNILLDEVDNVFFALLFDGDEVDFTIESPDHTIYTAQASSTARYLEINDPLPGNWSLTASSTDAQYQIFTIVESNIILDTQIEPIVSPGDDILISASLTASSTPVTGANVTATITDNEDNQYNLTLTHQGSGIYSNIFSQTSNPGYYDVAINASTTIASLMVNRQAFRTFEAINNPDLTISDFSVNLDDINYNLEFSATVNNLDNAPADDFTLRFYDGTPGDIMSTLVGEVDFSLGALGQQTFDLTTTTTMTTGYHHYWAVIPGYNDEDRYDNNMRSYILEIGPLQCSDGTEFNECSTNVPLYCGPHGKLKPNCQICGCPSGYMCISGTCQEEQIPNDPPTP